MATTIDQFPQRNGALPRFALFLSAGAIAAFGLFVVMAALVNSSQKSYEEPATPFTVTLFAVPEDKPTVEKVKPLPPPPVKSTPPKRPTPVDTTNSDPIGIGGTVLEVNVPAAELDDFTMGGAGNNDAVAIVQVEPRYPADAARNGIQGWVSLSFSIDELGQVDNVEVIDAEPKRVFEREAQKALKKWKYRPKVIDGQAVKQHNQSILLEFKLGQ
jgi:protein TonB